MRKFVDLVDARNRMFLIKNFDPKIVFRAMQSLIHTLKCTLCIYHVDRKFYQPKI